MSLWDMFKKGAPSVGTLGKWLWNNDVALLDQTLQNVTVSLFTEIIQSEIIQTEIGGQPVEQVGDVIAVHVTNLLSGRSLRKGYAPNTNDEGLLSAATSVRDVVLSGEYPNLSKLAETCATLLAIQSWYSGEFADCILIATHAASLTSGKPLGESFRVRGFARFALGEYEAALADMLEARRRQAGLVGINEPVAALRKLTKIHASSADKDDEPAGLQMNASH